MLAMLIVPFIFVITYEGNDWPNMLTLAVEVAAGVIIAAVVYIYSKAQNVANQESISRMNRVLDELERGPAEERKFATLMLTLRMDDVIRRLNYMLRMEANYENFTTDEGKEGWLDLQQKVTEGILSRSDVGFDSLALARNFGSDFALRYRCLRIKLSFIPREFLTVEEYARERTDYREECEQCIAICTELRDRVKSHANPSQAYKHGAA